MGKLSCFIVGAGYMGATHLECYLQREDIDVLGIVDANKEKGEVLASENGLKWFKTIDEAFAFSSANFCDICVPSFMHKDASVCAMEHGADVICEKPMAVDLADINIMIERAKKYGRRLMVAHVCRFMPQYYQLKEILDSGKLGNPLAFECARESETPAWTYNNWLYDRNKSGGTLLDLSIHDIDISNWLFGVPCYHRLESTSSKSMPGKNIVVSTLCYPNGVHSTIVANHMLPAQHPFVTSYRLMCEKGSVEYSSEIDPEHIYIYENGEKDSVSIASMQGFSNGYSNEINSFINAIKTGSSFVITDKEARLAVETVKNLYESMHENFC